MGSVSLTPDGKVLIQTPPDPHNGKKSKVQDPVDRVHSITSQIPNAHQHWTRSFDAHANRNQKRFRAESVSAIAPSPVTARIEDADDAFTKSTKRHWARLLRKILEVDPMLRPRCGVEMKIIAVITDAVVINKLLSHLASGRGHDPFAPRAPATQQTG